MASAGGAVRDFSWDVSGDSGAGRPNLCPQALIAGIFFECTGREYTAFEVDCRASGERVCRFVVNPAAGADAV